MSVVEAIQGLFEKKYGKQRAVRRFEIKLKNRNEVKNRNEEIRGGRLVVSLGEVRKVKTGGRYCGDSCCGGYAVSFKEKLGKNKGLTGCWRFEKK